MSLRSVVFAALVASIPVGFAEPAVRTAEAQGLPDEARQKAAANFKTANKSGTGKLDPAEFRVFVDLNAQSGVGRAQMIAARKLYDASFSGADKDKDGGVTFDEFMAVQAETQE